MMRLKHGVNNNFVVFRKYLATRAVQQYGDLGGQMRQGTFNEGRAADIAQQSSRDNRQAYDQFAFGAKRDLNNDQWGRGLDISTAQAGASDDTYNRSIDPWEWQAGLTSDRNASESGNTESTIKAAGDKYGSELASYSAWLTAPKPKPKRKWYEVLSDPAGIF